jgi:hypothetical protein
LRTKKARIVIRACPVKTGGRNTRNAHLEDLARCGIDEAEWPVGRHGSQGVLDPIRKKGTNRRAKILTIAVRADHNRTLKKLVRYAVMFRRMQGFARRTNYGFQLDIVFDNVY